MIASWPKALELGSIHIEYPHPYPRTCDFGTPWDSKVEIVVYIDRHAEISTRRSPTYWNHS